LRYHALKDHNTWKQVLFKAKNFLNKKVLIYGISGPSKKRYRLQSWALLDLFYRYWVEIFPIIDILNKCRIHAIGIFIKNNFFLKKESDYSLICYVVLRPTIRDIENQLEWSGLSYARWKARVRMEARMGCKDTVMIDNWSPIIIYEYTLFNRIRSTLNHLHNGKNKGI